MRGAPGGGGTPGRLSWGGVEGCDGAQEAVPGNTGMQECPGGCAGGCGGVREAVPGDTGIRWYSGSCPGGRGDVP